MINFSKEYLESKGFVRQGQDNEEISYMLGRNWFVRYDKDGPTVHTYSYPGKCPPGDEKNNIEFLFSLL
jgi:hypothetical protein